MINTSLRHDYDINYPSMPPYDPSEVYPEYSGTVNTSETNAVYASVRQLFCDMQMDAAHIGSSEWSPLSEFIKPGQTVVIKPNLVLNMSSLDEQVITTTHPSVVRAVIDYAWKALDGKGEVIVGDAPSSETDFQQLMKNTHYEEMVAELKKRGMNISMVDFRAVKTIAKDGIWVGEQAQDDTAAKSRIVGLGKKSALYGEKKKYHGGGYDIKLTTRHHSGDVQEYCVSQIVLDADVVISIPKLKSHRKAGVTCCLKNLVGINCDKDYLPHFAMGASNMGGDEMPAITWPHRLLMRVYNFMRENIIAYTWKYVGNASAKFLGIMQKKDAPSEGASHEKPVDSQSDTSTNKSTQTSAGWLHQKLSGQSVSSGAWQGNETIAKMIIDLNRIFLYVDQAGQLHDTVQRKVFYVVDGIQAGMGNGPVHATPAHIGVLACGYCGVKVDNALLRYLHIDPLLLPVYRRCQDIDWIWADSDGDILINGTKDDQTADMEFMSPDAWDYKV